MQASFTDFYKSQHSEKVNISMIPANNNLITFNISIN